MGLVKKIVFGVLVCLFLMGCSNQPPELHVSAAASLIDAMDEVKGKYEQEHDIELTFNFAGSGKLAQQIQNGAPVDVFISANENWLDMLVDENAIDTETRVNVTGNKLVLIAHKDSELPYSSFKDVKKEDVDQIAIGNPESVPAGEYAEAVLEDLGYWEELESKFVFAKDVRQVLTYVESGNAEIGFVYESDAISSEKVKILAESDPETHEPIIYPGAITSDSELKEEAGEFLEFLHSEEGQAILEKYGFTYE